MNINESSPSETQGPEGKVAQGLDKAAAGAHQKIDHAKDAAKPAVDHIAKGAHAAVDRVGEMATHTAEALDQKR